MAAMKLAAMKLGRNARLRIRFIVDTFLKNQTTVQKTKKNSICCSHKFAYF